MIFDLQLTNFKAHRDLKLNIFNLDGKTPRQLTCLVGPNASGKTSVLQAVRVATGLLGPDATSVMVGELSGPTLVAKGADGFEIGVGLTIGTKNARIAARTAEVEWNFGGAVGRRQVGGSTPVPQALSGLSVKLFRLDARAIAQPSYSDDEHPALSERGEFAASVLAYLKLADDPVFQAIESDLKAVVPTIQRLRIQPKKVLKTISNQRLWVNGHQIVVDAAGAHNTTADGLSDGTLLLLAILTSLHTASDGSVLLLDDIEHALHPATQAELVRAIKRLAARKPQMQIFFTTHSPYVIDELEPSQVLVFFGRQDGTIAVRPLSEHPDATRATGTLSAGQIWTLDPEDWVAEERTG